MLFFRIHIGYRRLDVIVTGEGRDEYPLSPECQSAIEKPGMGKKKKQKRAQAGSTGSAPEKAAQTPRVVNIPMSTLLEILDRAKPVLSEEDVDQLSMAVETLGFLTHQLEAKEMSLARLRRMLFGSSTESLKNVEKGTAKEDAENPESPKSEEGIPTTPGAEEKPSPGEPPEEKGPPAEKKRRKGHGRNGVVDFPGAQRMEIKIDDIKVGEVCVKCEKGKLYIVKEPTRMLRIEGMAPLNATVIELEVYRCNGCGTVFTARLPAGMSSQKYDETVTAMIAVLKYGCGMPFHRLEKLQESLGMPMPSSTQFKLVDEGSADIAPAWGALVEEAANGEVLSNDDTTMRVLDKTNLAAVPSSGGEERTGIFTTGIVSEKGDRKIALYYTGRHHAGENLLKVLSLRRAELGPPIQMCDALSRNTKGVIDTMLATCLAHGRRKFVETAENFPAESLHVLGEVGLVYHHDAEARRQGMTADERLLYHQTESGPIMEKLKVYMELDLSEKRVEPNSGLGLAYKYMLNHWDKLTLFLRVAGAPLDNNICEVRSVDQKPDPGDPGDWSHEERRYVLSA